jgi:hypothetical protein
MRACSPIAFVIACACTDGADRPTSKSAEPSTAKAEPAKEQSKAQPAKREWPADTPSPIDCKAHEDCEVVAIAPGVDPCCDVPVTIGSRSREYLAFIGQYRKQQCSGVECPPLALLGAAPGECANVARCLENRCDSACNDPSWRAKGAP